MTQRCYLSRGTDHLGLIGNKLRDLQGYRTLASELLQNADDARATSLSFDVTDKALTVDNNGVFSDCGHVEEHECPWKEERGYRCDFHRFRYVASGDKRGQQETIGAFGIGFIAVYQITDRPELISAGRHWKIREENPEDQRIEVCPGCDACQKENLPGTRFILSWAYEAESYLRKALRVEPVLPEGPRRFLQELKSFLPEAILFLNHLEDLSLLDNGRLMCRFEKIREGDMMIVSDGNPKNDRVWYLFHGDFSEEAKYLKQKHRGRIEDKRSPKVTLAISDVSLEKGLLYAYLPTDHNVELPFHVNADFYTTNDRKRVILDQDYQSEWNRAALRAAARVFGSAIEKLPDLLGPERLWALLERVQQVHYQNDGPRGEQVLKEFWECALDPLERTRVIYTTQGQWVHTTEAYLLLQKEEAKAIPALEALNLKIVNEMLRSYQPLLRELKVRVLDVDAIYTRLQELGLTRRMTSAELPPFLIERKHREALWGEIALLLERKPEAREKVRALTLAPGRDGAFWPCRDVYQADEETVSLFAPICHEVTFLMEDEGFEPIRDLCPQFTARIAVEILQKVDLGDLWQQKRLPIAELLQWFEKRRDEILQDATLKENLKRVPMFPAGGKLHPLTDLALPGNFQDRLGLAEVVDLAAIGGRRDFLRDLGVQELDFPTYATKFLPEALARDDVPAEKRRAAVQLLSRHLGQLKENHAAKDVLANVPLIECSGGHFRPAFECYFDTPAVRTCLGDSVPYAILDDTLKEPLEDLYRWLGVADEPRIEAILRKVHEISSVSYSPEAVSQIEAIVRFLGQHFENVDEAGRRKLKELRYIQWLPAEGRTDRWYRPDELYAVYQDYLFKSQALFLGLPRTAQNKTARFLEFLGVRQSPSPEMVVRHLLHCIDQQEPPHKDIYRFLSEKAHDPAIERLKEKKCLWLDGAYYASDQAFWQEHGFGRFRKKLDSELRKYSAFLTRIGVKEHPTWEDAIKVLLEISEEFGSGNKPLDQEALAVVWHCWFTLNEALEVEDDGAISQALKELRSSKCVPNDQDILVRPDQMFIENRSGLVEKFDDFLKHNIIAPPPNTRQALIGAGVRLLGDVIQVQILECEQPLDDSDLGDTIQTRLPCFERVVASAKTERIVQAQVSCLRSLLCRSATTIKVRYRLQAFDRERVSEAEQVLAIYVEAENTILFTCPNGAYPWSALARELAVAVVAEGDPGPLASGFKEVLTARTLEEAHRALDELGFAPLGDAVAQASGSGEVSKTLGEETLTETSAPPTVVPKADKPSEPDGDISPDEAVRQILGGNLQASMAPRDASDFAGTERGRRDEQTPQPREATRMVLRSYVMWENEWAEERPPDTGAESKSRVDQAGIERVMALERKAGRIPELLPHTHPGYDIVSKDKNGTPLRYIEVKSLSGEWRNQFVALSRTQFQKAQELGDKFWLYVVERAESEDYRIYPIPNPAAYANRFMFDDGWRDFAETEFGNSLEDKE